MFQVKIGIRNMVIPGARMHKIVVDEVDRTQDRAQPGHVQAHDPQVTADTGAVHRVAERRIGEPAEAGRARR